jgi:nicotinate dehydrogenase subunit B
MIALSRRHVLNGTGALVVWFTLLPGSRAQENGGLPASLKRDPLLDAWMRVGADGVVSVCTGKAELGQGIGTALIQLAAEELDVAPTRINLVTADTDRTPNEGFTAGSHSMQDSGSSIRAVAAQVRSLLLQRAAIQLGVSPNVLRVQDGNVLAPDGRGITYGALAAQLSLHVPARPGATLKQPSQYRLVGTSMPRVDIPAKVTGGPAFVQDIRLPGMLHARVLRQPSAGALLQDLDSAAVARMPGVVQVVRRGSYVAVVASQEWQAVKALRALATAAKWQESAELPGQAHILELLQSLPARDIPVMDDTAAAAPAVKQVSARYSKPYLIHGAIGPSCAVAQFQGGTLTVWTHTQGVFPLRAAIADLLGMPQDKVRCIQVQGSGCYGHNGADDAGADAALLASLLPGRPIRVQWMREQEHGDEPLGPVMAAEVRAALDVEGNVVDWHYDVWSNTHNRRPNVAGLLIQNAALPDPRPVPPPAPIPMPEGGGDRNSNPIYAFKNAHVIYHFVPEMPLRVSAMRSLGAYLNVFAIESCMDELAEAAGIDPITFRLRHLADQRARDVVHRAADAFGWSQPARPGMGRGFAFARYKNLGAFCAVALDLSVERESGAVRLGRVVAAVDSGQAVNPDGIRNQIEGAIIQSASWTLFEEARFDRRRVTSTDWSSYPILRFPALPESVAVHVIDRPGQPFLGTGEAGQGPTAAAIANALRHAVGSRLRDLPLTAAKVQAAIGV